MNERDIIQLIQRDKWMMDILRVARSLNLPDWMIGAGFVRNKVWDYLHNKEGREDKLNDIDLVYFDEQNISPVTDDEYARSMALAFPQETFDVKNQARMHKKYNRNVPYKNTVEALSEWVETATCVAVRIECNDTLSIFAPHGLDDLVNMAVRLTPVQKNNEELLMKRVGSKRWLKKWPKLRICY